MPTEGVVEYNDINIIIISGSKLSIESNGMMREVEYKMLQNDPFVRKVEFISKLNRRFLLWYAVFMIFLIFELFRRKNQNEPEKFFQILGMFGFCIFSQWMGIKVSAMKEMENFFLTENVVKDIS